MKHANEMKSEVDELKVQVAGLEFKNKMVEAQLTAKELGIRLNEKTTMWNGLLGSGLIGASFSRFPNDKDNVTARVTLVFKDLVLTGFKLMNLNAKGGETYTVLMPPSGSFTKKVGDKEEKSFYTICGFSRTYSQRVLADVLILYKEFKVRQGQNR
jgi:hypothetical protein